MLLLLGCTTHEQTKYYLKETSYPTLEEAVKANYHTNDHLTIFQSGEKKENIWYVLYSINEDQLISQLFYKSETGYRTIEESRLIIGGTPITEADQKIRTFLVTEGPWKTENHPFTFVTFGLINNISVNHVEVRYEGQYKKVFLENKTFFNIASSIHQWDTLHPVIFYTKDKDDVGGYLRNLSFLDAYCH